MHGKERRPDPLVLRVLSAVDPAIEVRFLTHVASVRGIDALTALTRATAEFERRLAAVPAGRWQDPTPCEAWTVQDIADHITGGNRFAVLILGGATVADAVAQVRSGDFSDDPLTAFRASAAAQIGAFSRSGAMTEICHHTAGDIPGQRFAGLRVGDLIVHAWDIARATGIDEHLDEELARESCGARLLDLAGQRAEIIAG